VKETNKKERDELRPGMTRKERRAWFHANRKDLNLPQWGELHNLKPEE